jgi:hypothetical protein
MLLAFVVDDDKGDAGLGVHLHAHTNFIGAASFETCSRLASGVSVEPRENTLQVLVSV